MIMRCEAMNDDYYDFYPDDSPPNIWEILIGLGGMIAIIYLFVIFPNLR